MRYCRDCGSVVNEDNNYCPSCGALLHTVPSQSTTPNTTKSEDGNNPGLNVLSFFIPLVGLILYLIWMTDYPIRAKGCGKWALISVIVDLVLGLIGFFIYIIIIILIYVGLIAAL